jgi:acetylornithine/succinyldiaminopimelate/putrescine aminotransferase
MVESKAYASFSRHVNPAMARFLAVSGRDYEFVSAQGATLTTRAGEELTDWVAGFGTLNFGHNPVFLKRVLADALQDTAPHIFSEALNPYAGQLAAALVSAAGPRFETCFFANGGSEAVEAALKAALLATGRPKLAYAAGGYHGTTLGSLACMAEGLYREPFEAILPQGFVSVPFGDAAALEAVLAEGDVAGFLCEPIQMEGGVRIAHPDYLRAARALCDRYGTQLIFDEIQTGLGRTGRLFAFEHAKVEPDIFTLGKALGGGLLPISAAVFAEGVWQRAYGSILRSEIHNSTLGGNALCARVGLAVLEEASSPTFLEAVRARSAFLEAHLGPMLARHRSVQRLSLCGLLGGVAFSNVTHPWATWSGLGMPDLEPRPSSAALLVQRLAKRGIWAQLCGHDWSVLRIEPPLTVSEEDCQAFVDALDEGITWLESNAFDD